MAENADGNDVEDNIENVVNGTEIENDETYNDNNVNDDKNIENEDAKDGTTEENNNIDIAVVSEISGNNLRTAYLQVTKCL